MKKLLIGALAGALTMAGMGAAWAQDNSVTLQLKWVTQG
jgi:NitT/TauT family transport system substrate-binding protein